MAGPKRSLPSCLSNTCTLEDPFSYSSVQVLSTSVTAVEKMSAKKGFK